MGQCSSTPSSEDVDAGVAVASKAILNLTRPVPIVGEVAQVLLKVAETYEKLAGVSREADAVAAWATRVGREFKTLKSSLSKRGSASSELSKNLCDEVKEAAECIDALLSVAKKINGARGCCTGSKPARLLKLTMFKAKFEAAQNAVERARVELDRTLAIDTNVTVHDTNDTVHTVEVEVGGLRDDVKRILAKIEENGDANERQLQRGLVESVKHQPELLTVAEMVVDGDGAGASAALAEAPVEMRESAAAKYAEGVALFQQKKWSEAIAALQRSVELDSRNSRAWFALGYALDEHNGAKSSEAQIEAYQQCIALDPKHSMAHNNLGSVLQDVRKDYVEAEEMYRKAIELDPKFAMAHNNLGILMENVRKDYDGAERHYRKAIELDPKHVSAHNNLGLLLQTVRKDYEGAERHYRKAIALNPKLVDVYLCLGSFLQDVRKDYDGAELHFRKAIELDPKHVSAHLGLGVVLKDVRKDYDGAEKLFRKAIELDPKLVDVYFILGSFLQDVRKDYDGAEKMYRKTIELNEKETYARWALSIILEEQKNDIPGAVKLMEEYVNLGGIPGWNDGKERLAKLRAKLETTQ